MPELTDKQKAALERLRQFRQKVTETPPERHVPISNPDKYGFPVGLDDKGNPFPLTSRPKKPAKSSQGEDLRFDPDPEH